MIFVMLFFKTNNAISVTFAVLLTFMNSLFSFCQFLDIFAASRLIVFPQI